MHKISSPKKTNKVSSCGKAAVFLPFFPPEYKSDVNIIYDLTLYSPVVALNTSSTENDLLAFTCSKSTMIAA